MLYLNEDQSFSMSANVVSPGYQSLVLKGYLLQDRSDGRYAAPLLPALFYGVDGLPLSTWRQYIPSAGSQVILSRSGGLPTLPREELAWQKVAEREVAEVEVEKPVEIVGVSLPIPLIVASIVCIGAGALLYILRRK